MWALIAALLLYQVGVTNAVLQGVGGLTKLRSLHIPDAFRVTDAGLRHLSTLTGAPNTLPNHSQGLGDVRLGFRVMVSTPLLLVTAWTLLGD